jgi:hypothetical protein
MAAQEPQRRENRERDQRRSGIGDSAQNLSRLFTPPVPVPAPVPVAVPVARGQKKRFKGVPFDLGSSLLPHQRITTPAIPISGPTRFGSADCSGDCCGPISSYSRKARTGNVLSPYRDQTCLCARTVTWLAWSRSAFLLLPLTHFQVMG